MRSRRRNQIAILTITPVVFFAARYVWNSGAAAYLALCGPTMPAGIQSFTVSPSRNVVVFATTESRLYAFDVRKQTSRRLLAGCGSDQRDPTYSPDGRYLAYSARSNAGGNSHHLFVTNLKSESKPTQVTTDGDDYVPSFSADGTSLVFQRIIPYARLLGPYVTSPFAIDLHSGKETRLTTKTYAATSRGNDIEVNAPHYAKHDSEVFYYGSERSEGASGANDKCGIFEIELDNGGIVIPRPPSYVDIPNHILSIDDAFPTQDGTKLLISTAPTAPAQSGLWLTNMRLNTCVRIESMPTCLKCRSPYLTDTKAIYFLAETGNGTSGAPVDSLWVCHPGDSKPSVELIGLEYLASLK